MKDSRFDGGAVRSADVASFSYTSLPLVGLMAVARTGGEGAGKYGRLNYMLGMPVHDLLDHAFHHLVKFLLGDRDEPHLPHAAWGIMAAIQSLALDPEKSAPHLLGPGATLTPAVREFLASQAPDFAARRASGELADAGKWKVEELPDVRHLLEARAEALFSEPVPPRPDREDMEKELREAFRVNGVTIGEIHKDTLDRAARLSAIIPQPRRCPTPGPAEICPTCPGNAACEILGCARQEPGIIPFLLADAS